MEGGEAPEPTDSLPGLSSALFPFNIPMKIEVSGKIGRGGALIILPKKS